MAVSLLEVNYSCTAGASPLRGDWGVADPDGTFSIVVRYLAPHQTGSTRGEGHERRYFYGSAWAVCTAQPVLGLLWLVLPYGRAGDIVKLVTFVSVLAYFGVLARRGVLPRTRPIVPGELAVSD